VDAGIALLTIHGRNRKQKGYMTGPADWNAIRRVVDTLGHRIPILANGSLDSYDAAIKCLEITRADGVMTAEAVLEYPPLFFGPHSTTITTRTQIALEYIALCRQHPPHIHGQGSKRGCVRLHLHRFLYGLLREHTHLRDALCRANPEHLDVLERIVRELDACETTQNPTELIWYHRHRKNKANDGLEPSSSATPTDSSSEESDDDNISVCCLFE
jgi:tRNA-dihydrouridine synthase 1